MAILVTFHIMNTESMTEGYHDYYAIDLYNLGEAMESWALLEDQILHSHT